MKRLIIGAALAVLFTAPALAQSYSSSYGTGNTVNLPLAEQTNGAEGVGAGDYSPMAAPASPYAYAPMDRTVQQHHIVRHQRPVVTH